MTTNTYRRPPDINIQELKMIKLSAKDIALVFKEWDKRYRENPEEFTSEAWHLLKENPESYSESAAYYFIKLVNELEL